MFFKVADFLHFWRVNGWYLGVKDDNNAALDVGICKQCRDRCFLIFFSTEIFPAECGGDPRDGQAGAGEDP